MTGWRGHRGDSLHPDGPWRWLLLLILLIVLGWVLLENHALRDAKRTACEARGHRIVEVGRNRLCVDDQGRIQPERQ